MKVLSLNTEAVRGGAAKTAYTLMEAINSTRKDCSVTLYHTGTEADSPAAVNINRTGSRYINATLQRLLGDSLIWDRGVANHFVEASKDCDVLHLHNLHGYYLEFPKMLEKLANKPIVWTWHDMWPLTGRCGFPENCDQWKSGCTSCPDKSIYPAAWIDNAHRDHSKRFESISSLERLKIICPSAWLRSMAIDRGYPAEIINVIPNPVELSNFKALNKTDCREKLGIEDPGALLLFVAADLNDPRKGFQDFEKIVSELNCRALAVGRPPNARHENISYAGVIKDPAILNLYYSAADGYVITSSMDNYPNTVIEALASGTPVFGYDVGGIPEQMIPGIDCLAKFGEASEVAARIQRHLVLGDSTNIRAVARNHALSLWAPSIVAEKYVEEFFKLLSN